MRIDEVAWDKKSYELGKKWIIEHPAAFAVLAVRKALILFGADNTGVYWSVQRVYGPSLFYEVSRWASNLYWLLLWCVVLWVATRRSWLPGPLEVALVLTFGMIAAVHCVWESQARYHMPVTPLLMLLAASGLNANQRAASMEPLPSTIAAGAR